MEDFNINLSSITKWWNDEQQIEVLKAHKFVNDEVVDFIKTIIPLLNEVYPNRWDIQISIEYNRSRSNYTKDINVVIHFPKVTITNSRKESLDMYDMFVSFSIAYNGSVNIGHIKGTKTKFSFSEYQSNYFHSHLQTQELKKDPSFRGFCTGSGVINQLQMMLNQSEQFDPNMFKMYLFQIYRFISWESLEGGPYTYMKNVHIKSDNHNLNVLTTSDITDYVHTFNKSLWNNEFFFDDIDIDLDTEGSVYVIDNERFEKFVLDTVGYHGSFLCSKDDEGNYVNLENYSKKINISDKPIYFKGKAIYYDVDFKLPVKSQVRYAHPTIKQICKKILEHELNKETIKVTAFQ